MRCLDREPRPDRAEGIALDDAGLRHAGGDRRPDMIQPGRAPGEEQRVDLAGGKPGLSEAVLDSLSDAPGKPVGLPDQVLARQPDGEARLKPGKRHRYARLVGEADLRVL